MGSSSDPESLGPQSTTVIGLKRSDQIVIAVVTVVGGAVLLTLMPITAQWLLSNLPWFPWQGPFELALAVEERLTRWGLAGIGAVLGLLVGFFIVAGEPIVEISTRHICVSKGDDRHRFARAQVGAAGIESKHLVVFDHEDVEFLHLKVDRRDDIATALRDKGWPSG